MGWVAPGQRGYARISQNEFNFNRKTKIGTSYLQRGKLITTPYTQNLFFCYFMEISMNNRPKHVLCLLNKVTFIFYIKLFKEI